MSVLLKLFIRVILIGEEVILVAWLAHPRRILGTFNLRFLLRDHDSDVVHRV